MMGKRNPTAPFDLGMYTTRMVDLELPTLAKDEVFLRRVQATLQDYETRHTLRLGDARNLSFLEDRSVHLVVTSPPYWTLKDYNPNEAQLGSITEYDRFHSELNKVWSECLRLLVPGGRLVVVVGDVLLSRRKAGRHRVVPLHADIQVNCTRLGFDNLAPIFWYKIANAAFEAEGNGGTFLGKPYEPNAVVKHDVEYILMLRKPGGYRSPDPQTRLLSVIGASDHQKWFQQVWSDLPGESTKHHPAPFPVELAERLIKMFSFVGDTVLDPFSGTGTTTVAAIDSARNSVSVEIDPDYFEYARKRITRESVSLYRKIQFRSIRS